MMNASENVLGNNLITILQLLITNEKSILITISSNKGKKQ